MKNNLRENVVDVSRVEANIRNDTVDHIRFRDNIRYVRREHKLEYLVCLTHHHLIQLRGYQ